MDDEKYLAQNERFFTERSEVRETTRDLIDSVMMDMWPRNTAIVDFGLDSQRHYEALYYPIREWEIMPKQLDEALGHGEMLSKLVKEAPSNPHKDIEFSTSWDLLLGRSRESAAQQQKQKDYGIEPEI